MRWPDVWHVQEAHALAACNRETSAKIIIATSFDIIALATTAPSLDCFTSKLLKNGILPGSSKKLLDKRQNQYYNNYHIKCWEKYDIPHCPCLHETSSDTNKFNVQLSLKFDEALSLNVLQETPNYLREEFLRETWGRSPGMVPFITSFYTKVLNINNSLDHLW